MEEHQLIGGVSMKFNASQELFERIETRRRNGKDLKGLKALLAQYHNPQLQLRCLHVGGTNGKGSTVSVLASILQEAGYRVGTFTSPYLECHHDRIRINQQFIKEETILRYANTYYEEWMKYELSSFEIDMFMAVMYFHEQRVDFAVFEVGLGGAKDATNIIRPLASIITNIGMDHMELLGDSYEKIAQAKAGIIKIGVPLYVMEQNPICLKVFEKECAIKLSPFIVCDPVRDAKVEETLTFHYQGMDIEQPTLALYQANNTALAIRVIKDLHRERILNISDEIIKKAIAHTHWDGRFEIVSQKPRIIIDGAHNVEGIRALVQSCKALGKVRILFAALQDKPYQEMLSLLCDVSDDVSVCDFDFYRAAKAETIAKDTKAKIVTDYREVIASTKEEETLVICGSLYFISIVRKYIKVGVVN